MAPIKLEENIREKLETREIQPSKDAWKKLESRLGPNRLKKKKIQWYSTAAVFVGILMISSVFFKGKEEGTKVVEKRHQEKIMEKEKEVTLQELDIEEIVASPHSEKPNPESNMEKQKSTSTEVKPAIRKNVLTDEKSKRNPIVAEPPIEQTQQNHLTKEDLVLSEEEHLNRKVDEVVAQLQHLQKENPAITADDVETLLINARRDIQEEQISPGTKVDATALLRDVEWELDQGFRDKVYDALGESFQKFKTAVINRNY